MYVFLREIYRNRGIFRKVNWIKTIYFNFKKFPFSIAIKFPVFFYGRVRFQSINGNFIIDAPIQTGMIGFGQSYEQNTVHKGIAEIVVEGKIVFKGPAQFGKDYFVSVSKNAYLEFGYMAGLASDGKIVCSKSIILGNYVRIASESRIMDSDFHEMADTITGEKFSMTIPIVIGSYNFIANRASILKGTITPDYCTVASNSLCNKDYRNLGQNILIGGIPAKLLKNNITRDWDTEKDLLDKWMKIWN